MKFIKKHIFLLIIIIIIFIAISLPFVFTVYEAFKKSYTADDFGIETVLSSEDANNNGIDDYTDIMLGAREDAKNHPRYDGKYWPNGYPPDNVGVCADVIWRAFKYAGYDLKTMVDNDIQKNMKVYNLKSSDPNIDFRRVRNLYIFFNRYAESLTLDINEIEAWQPGDIVIFGEKHTHIGIISDKRNKKGIPYLIHNSGQPLREEDILAYRAKKDGITGHFRFNAQNIDNLVYWLNSSN